MRVYKFLNSKWAREAIQRKRIKISLLTGLNDPWDCHGVHFQSDAQRQSWQRALRVLSQSRGLVCFSTNWSDPVLWSHYADQHQGIALGFDIEGEAIPVAYQHELIPFPENFPGAEIDEKLDFVKKAVSTKFTHWQYEREVRFFTNLDEPDTISNHFFIDFGPEFALKEIIFGARYVEPTEEAVILSIARRMPSVECIRAKLGETTFEVVPDQTWKFQRL